MQELNDGELPSDSDEEEHNEWNKVLGICLHFRVGPHFQDNATDLALGRLALSCHFALDILWMSG